MVRYILNISQYYFNMKAGGGGREGRMGEEAGFLFRDNNTVVIIFGSARGKRH